MQKKVDPTLLQNTLQSVVKQIGQKFTYSHVDGGYRTEAVKEALNMLCDAGLIMPVVRTSANGLPLGAEANVKFRKFIFLDSGLLLRIFDLDIDGTSRLTEQILSDTAAELVNKGSVTEMVVGLELVKYANPQKRYDLFYWENVATGTTSEVDYIISRFSNVLPVEVKAGTSGKMKSLHQFMTNKNLHKAVRCSLENFGSISDRIEIIPIYAISNI